MFSDISAHDRTSLWIELLNRIKPRTALEIGVWKGEFATDMLRATPSITRYYMIDPWRRLDHWNKPLNTEDFEHAYQDALRATAFAKERIEVLRGTTAERFDQIPDYAKAAGPPPFPIPRPEKPLRSDGAFAAHSSAASAECRSQSCRQIAPSIDRAMSRRVVDPARLDRLVGPPPRPYLHAAKIKSRFPKKSG
jgi:hypothetical protein